MCVCIQDYSKLELDNLSEVLSLEETGSPILKFPQLPVAFIWGTLWNFFHAHSVDLCCPCAALVQVSVLLMFRECSAPVMWRGTVTAGVWVLCATERSFLDDQRELPSSVGRRIDTQNEVRDYTSLIKLQCSVLFWVWGLHQPYSCG